MFKYLRKCSTVRLERIHAYIESLLHERDMKQALKHQLSLDY